MALHKKPNKRCQSRISVPLLERMDLHVPVPEQNHELMFAASKWEPEHSSPAPLAEL